MKASLTWLSRYLNLEGLTPEEIADKLTFAGAEVEGIEIPASGTNLVIGQILSCSPHPSSDHLHILSVDEGPKYGTVQIVCGAPNARTGLKVIVARPGAKLPAIEIKPSVIRGVESNGMCCSLAELGVDKKYLSDYQLAGIEELPSDAKVGEEDVLGYLGLKGATLEVSVLPNRPDLYAIENIAREVGCLLGQTPNLETPKEHKLEDTSFIIGSATPKCPLFGARVVHNVVNGPSPKWLSDLLREEGVRSISKVVDIGNYIMLLTGQPLNMYDADKLPKEELTVIDDYEGEFKAMDGNTYHLQKGDLLVSSNREPMCLAGIMTADACRVDETTKSIVVEAAYFSGASIRHTSNRLGLASDSSLRFCKGVNPHQTERVLELTTDLLVELCSASNVSKTVLYDTLSHVKKVISTSLGYINGRLGTSFGLDEVIETLRKDNFEVEADGENLEVTVPFHRLDVEGEADISEEVIRLLGYENVPSTLPLTALSAQGLTPNQTKIRAIRSYLRDNGLAEALTYTLISKEEDEKYCYLNTGEPYVLLNPMSEDRSTLRRNLAHSLLLIGKYNAERQNGDLAFYEISDVDSQSKKGKHLCLLLSGNCLEQGRLKAHPYGYYDVKGYLEGILELLSVKKNRYTISALSNPKDEFHPGRSAELKVGRETLAVFGELHPKALERYGLKSGALLELDLSAALNIKSGAPKAVVPTRFPSVSRDLAVLLPKTVIYSDLEKEAQKADSLILEVEVFDVYEGDHLPENKKSVALKLTFLSPERTLKDEEVNASFAKVVSALKAKFGAEVRG